MAKHRLGQSEGGQWGGPDLVNGAEDALRRSESTQSDQTTDQSQED